jgi:hypothetical protein
MRRGFAGGTSGLSSPPTPTTAVGPLDLSVLASDSPVSL